MLMLIRENIPQYFPPFHINDDQYEFSRQIILVSGRAKHLFITSYISLVYYLLGFIDLVYELSFLDLIHK
jgi:hypothetical protein